MTDHHIRNVGTSQVHKINTDMLKLSDKYLNVKWQSNVQC